MAKKTQKPAEELVHTLDNLPTYIRSLGRFGGTASTGNLIAKFLQIPETAVRCYDHCIDDAGDKPGTYVMKACYDVNCDDGSHTVRIYYLDSNDEIGCIDIQ